MRHQVTIKDIAKQLNVSVATVSRALRDLPDIHPDTKKRSWIWRQNWIINPMY